MLACTHSPVLITTTIKKHEHYFCRRNFFLLLAHISKASTCHIERKGLRERERDTAIMAVFGDKGEGERRL